MDEQYPNDNQLITDAINAHGIFFKKAVRRTLEQEINGVEVIGEEYPISYLKGTALDLLVRFDADRQHFMLPIECKRAYTAQKRWVFFEDPDKGENIPYTIEGLNLSVGASEYFVKQDVPICVEGVEISSKENRQPTEENRQSSKSRQSSEPDKEYVANPNTIWEAAFQLGKGSLGFILEELKQRTQNPRDSFDDLVIIPLMITTAPLFVCKFIQSSLDILDGRYQEEAVFEDVPWLILNYSFTPSQEFYGEHLTIPLEGYSNPKMPCLKTGISILNSAYISNFFSMLNQLDKFTSLYY